MSWKGYPGKGGDRVRLGRRTLSVPSVPSMTDPDPPTPASTGASAPAAAERQPTIDRNAVQYLDSVRAIFRPTGSSTGSSTGSDGPAPGLERFVGREDIFRHVGITDVAGHGAQAMMQCPSYWPEDVTWVPIRDLEILEILEDQDVRAG